MADVTIDGLPPATNVLSTDIIPISNGTTTFKATIQQILSVNSNAYMVDYLVVAGGGAGGNAYYGGGGGAGGVLYGSTYVDVGVRYPIIVGAGGTVGNNTLMSYPGKQGGNSSFLNLIAIGGGGGGSDNSWQSWNGRRGGSGGGCSGYRTNIDFGPAGVLGQGFDGSVGGGYGGGGGGGANGNGLRPTSSDGGAGGPGLTWLNGSIYGGGGGGSSYGGTGGAGGSGGGGNGASGASGTPSAATANTGGGGGGASNYTGAGGSLIPGAAGGSGIVILRYYGSQKGSGGTYSSAGGYSYHSFTSVGSTEVYVA